MNHPLEVESMSELETSGNAHWYYSKGHHPVDAFASEVFEEFDVQINPAKVEHIYLRKVPYDWRYAPAIWQGFFQKHPARGACPITIIDITVRDALVEA